MANWIYDDIAALLNTTTVLDGKVSRLASAYPYIIVSNGRADTPPATANESSFERSYSATLELFASSDANLETLIETCYTAFSAASTMYNPSAVYERTDLFGVKTCKLDISKEEIILPGAF